MSNRTLTLTTADSDREYAVDLIDDGGRRAARVGEVEYSVDEDGPGQMRITSVAAVPAWAIAVGDTRWVFVDGRAYRADGSASGRARTERASGFFERSDAGDGAAGARQGRRHGEARRLADHPRSDEDGTPGARRLRRIVQSVRCREGELVQPGVALIEIKDA